MKNLNLLSLLFCILISGYSFAHNPPNPLTEGFITGNPEIQSMNSLAFGPEGILFIGDSRSANIYALDTKDKTPSASRAVVRIEQIDAKIAAMAGTTPDKVNIQDMAVNPVSKMIYLAVHLADGTPLLLKTQGQELEHVSTEKVSYSKIALEKPVAEDAKDRRGRSMRQLAISDLSWHNNKVLVSGLSNEEFSSTFRSIPFPFNQEQTASSLEIYHAAHGRYETYAPIKTFMAFPLNGKDHLVASFTCTPLVVFPMDEMKAGKHSKGRTVAELGNRNVPLDIISYQKEGKDYLLLANSSRALMKIDPEKIAAEQPGLTERVKEKSATAGIDFISLPYVNVQQLDAYSDTDVLMIQRKSNGHLDLQTVNKKRL